MKLTTAPVYCRVPICVWYLLLTTAYLAKCYKNVVKEGCCCVHSGVWSWHAKVLKYVEVIVDLRLVCKISRRYVGAKEKLGRWSGRGPGRLDVEGGGSVDVCKVHAVGRVVREAGGCDGAAGVVDGRPCMPVVGDGGCNKIIGIALHHRNETLRHTIDRYLKCGEGKVHRQEAAIRLIHYAQFHCTCIKFVSFVTCHQVACE